jgi:hypothetical protein
MHIFGFLEVDKLAHVVLLRESADEFVFVLIETPHQIAGDSNVHDSVIPVSQKINVIAIFSGHFVLGEKQRRKISRFGRNDTVGRKDSLIT